jgi:hypothetical protein
LTSLHELRAPQGDGELLAEPPLDRVGGLLAENHRRLTGAETTVGGRPLTELRRQAAGEALTASADYHREAGEPVPPAEPGRPLILAGHQPELFHPGVWVKNFALSDLARRHRATALNLVVDNDIAKTASLRVPDLDAGEPSAVRLVTVPFDHWAGEAPYEERAVRDEAVFASLPERVAEHTENWPAPPILPEFWQDVLRQRGRTPLLGERVAAARRGWERRWGCHNRELPLSRLCRTEAFAAFAAHLLADLPRFQAVYNAAVHDYRRRHGIRSRNHPVPDLGRDGDWWEAPFWGWRAGAERRGRLMVRREGTGLLLRAGDEVWPTPHGADGRGWQEPEAGGLKVRSRALTTTLFARLCLGDLFVHGIGGGKYDELTDELLRRFFGLEPPGYLVLSGTLRLPLPRFEGRPSLQTAAARLARDVYWNPQRHLDEVHQPGSWGELKRLADEKRAWIDRTPTDPAGRRERFHELRRLTEALRPRLADTVARLREKVVRTEAEVRANAVIARRDFAFCLYPERELRAFCESVRK